MHRHYLSKVLNTQLEWGRPVHVITGFSSALNKHITHLELHYPFSNPFSMGPILRLWSLEQLPKFMIKINMYINYKALNRVVFFSSQGMWVSEPPKEFLSLAPTPTPPNSGARGLQVACPAQPCPQAATSPACPLSIWPSPSAVPFNTKSQQDPNTMLIKQQEVC